jgi:membrane-bound lytic murein transglycosylase MltF
MKDKAVDKSNYEKNEIKYNLKNRQYLNDKIENIRYTSIPLQNMEAMSAKSIQRLKKTLTSRMNSRDQDPDFRDIFREINHGIIAVTSCDNEEVVELHFDVKTNFRILANSIAQEREQNDKIFWGKYEKLQSLMATFIAEGGSDV